jgi:hypothetical protein
MILILLLLFSSAVDYNQIKIKSKIMSRGSREAAISPLAKGN